MHTAAATVARITRADSATWGRAIEASARTAAAALVVAYTAGLVLGAWVHRLSDALASLVSGLTRTTGPQRASRPPAARRSHRPSAMTANPTLAPSERRAALIQTLAS